MASVTASTIGSWRWATPARRGLIWSRMRARPARSGSRAPAIPSHSSAVCGGRGRPRYGASSAAPWLARSASEAEAVITLSLSARTALIVMPEWGASTLGALREAVGLDAVGLRRALDPVLGGAVEEGHRRLAAGIGDPDLAAAVD